MPDSTTDIKKTIIAPIAESFGLGCITDVSPLGGTATQKFAVTSSPGRWVVRARPGEFADPAMIRFDHEALRRLADAGLPVPRPQSQNDGTTWLTHYGHTWEVLSWVEGDAFVPGVSESVIDIGRFLAKFHRAFANNIPSGKENFVREDHPDKLFGYVTDLADLTCDKNILAKLENIIAELNRIKSTLDMGLYDSLPHAVIHGDFHPGNVRFKNNLVSAVYDFDYLSPQARARDLADALMFFCSDRPAPLNPDSIVSLTEPFIINSHYAAPLLSTYHHISPLTEPEWRSLPWLIRSRWLQIRLRGSRKVAADQKINFVLDRFFDVIDWLDRHAENFFNTLRISI